MTTTIGRCCSSTFSIKLFALFILFLSMFFMGHATMIRNGCRGSCCVHENSLFVLMDGKEISQEEGVAVCWGCKHQTRVYLSPKCNTTSITGSCKFAWYWITRSFEAHTFNCSQLGGEGVSSCPVIQKGHQYYVDLGTEISDLTWGEVNGQYICKILDDQESVIATMEFPCKVTSKQNYFH